MATVGTTKFWRKLWGRAATIKCANPNPNTQGVFKEPRLEGEAVQGTDNNSIPRRLDTTNLGWEGILHYFDCVRFGTSSEAGYAPHVDCIL